METLNDILEGSAIAPWEVMFYAFLACGYVLMGLFRSFLLVTFVFTYYWGFKVLLEILSFSEGVSQGTVTLYIGSGLTMFGLVSVSCLTKKAKGH